MVKAKKVAGRSDCKNASNPFHRCTDCCSNGIDESAVGMKGIIKASSPLVHDGGGGGRENIKNQQKFARGVVNPDCVNASNPFHVCADYCNRIPGQSNSPAVKLKSGVKERSLHPGCPDASNPYHVCAPYCLEKISKNSAQMGKKQPDPIFIDSFNDSSKTKRKGDTKSHQSYKTIQSSKDDSNRVSTSADSLSSPVKNEDLSPNDPKSPHHPFSGKSLKPQDESRHSLPLMGSSSSNTSGVTTATLGDDEDEPPKNSESKVLVGNYYIDDRNSSLLQTIFDQHGDIAAGCVLESALMRTYYLDSVCSVVRHLQSTSPFTMLTRSRARELSAILDDLESARIQVGWLRERLDEVTGAMELIGRHRSIKAAKARCDESLEAMRKELESLMTDLVQREEEMAERKERVREMKRRMSELEAEAKELEESYCNVKLQVEKLQLKPMLDGATATEAIVI